MSETLATEAVGGDVINYFYFESDLDPSRISYGWEIRYADGEMEVSTYCTSAEAQHNYFRELRRLRENAGETGRKAGI